MYLFGHKITWLEVKGFLKEVSAVVGVAVTVAHADHLTLFYQGLGLASSTLLVITHAINTKTNAALKVAKDPS